MAIIAKETGGAFIPAPPGVHQGVCCDVVDLGVVESTYDGKSRSAHKIRVVWEIDERKDSGERFTANRRYTLSLNEKASLRKDLESWRGRPFTTEELKDGFDIEKLLGANCMVNIVHTSRNGKGPYADVTALMPLHRGMTKITVSAEYVRVKDRKEVAGTSDGSGGYDPSDDDVPF